MPAGQLVTGKTQFVVSNFLEKIQPSTLSLFQGIRCSLLYLGTKRVRKNLSSQSFDSYCEKQAVDNVTVKNNSVDQTRIEWGKIFEASRIFSIHVLVNLIIIRISKEEKYGHGISNVFYLEKLSRKTLGYTAKQITCFLILCSHLFCFQEETNKLISYILKYFNYVAKFFLEICNHQTFSILGKSAIHTSKWNFIERRIQLYSVILKRYLLLQGCNFL